MSHVIAANASCVQYLKHACPPDLPMTGYVLIPIGALGALLLVLGIVGLRRSGGRS